MQIKSVTIAVEDEDQLAKLTAFVFRYNNEDAGEDETPKRTRARRSTKADDEKPEDDTPKRTRARRSKSDEAPAEEDKPKGRKRSSRKSSKKEDAGISDADMTKGASEAADIITPAIVTEIMTEYGVASVDEIKQSERQEFLDQLQTEIDAENKAGE